MTKYDRKEPKKCPKCKSFMEPKFDRGLASYGMNLLGTHNTRQQPKEWVCDCGYKEESEVLNND